MTNDNAKYKTGLRRFLAAIIDAFILVPLGLVDIYVRVHLDNKTGLLFWLNFMTALTIFYSVFMHYKYGQTFGKMFVNVKVVNSDEVKTLTIRQALLRDSFYILMAVSGFFYFIFVLIKDDLSRAEILEGFDNFGGLIAIIWVILELTSMLTNEKRRAIHDFIANSVVIKTDLNDA